MGRPAQITYQQRTFINEWIRNGQNAPAAARTAGYAESVCGNAGNLLKRPLIKNEIDRVLRKAREKTEATAEYILGSLKEVADACKERKMLFNPFTGEPLKDPETGKPKLAQGVVDSAGANRSLELLGKNKKLWVDTMEVKRGEYDDMTDEELIAVVNRRAAAAPVEVEAEPLQLEPPSSSPSTSSPLFEGL